MREGGEDEEGMTFGRETFYLSLSLKPLANITSISTHLSRHCHKSEHYTKTNHTTITMADQTVPTTEAGMKMECRGDMSEGNGEGDGEESDGDDSGEDGEEAVG